eukprot:1182651-Prymnesium_polylepis.1
MAAEQQRCRFLRVSGLPGGTEEKDVEKLFKPFGKIERIRLDTRNNTGLVDMSCTREATLAQRELAFKTMRGISIRVDFETMARSEIRSHDAPSTSSAAALGSARDREGDKGGGRDAGRDAGRD